MSFNSSRRASKTKKESIVREIGSGMFIAIRTIDELEDIISTSEAYMTDPTVIFNGDNTKVLFYYNTKGRNEIEEMETLFKRTVKSGSTITLSDAFYLDEASGDDTVYDLSGTYKFEKYDTSTKTIIASPISINKQSDTYLTYNSKYWTGSLLWTTSDPIHTRTSSYEIVNFLGSSTEHSFIKVFGDIQENDKIEVEGVGSFTVKEYKVDADEEWERIVVKEPIPEKDLLGEKTFITILRSDRNQPKEPTQETIPLDSAPTSVRKGKSGACCYGARICDKLNTHNTCIDGVYDGECIGSNAKFYEGKKCDRTCCGKYQDVVPSSQYIGEYSKEDCDSDPNTHWMGSSATGYCMEGAKHSWRQSTATRNLNIRNPNMGY